MIQNVKLAKLLDTMAMKMLSLVFKFLALILLLWAVFIVLVQCFGWLKSGSWQGVAVGLLFVSQEAHNFIQTMGLAPNAIEFVPSWGSALSVEGLAAKSAGQAVGLQMIYSWLLATPLVFWVVIVAVVLLWLEALVAQTTVLIHDD